MDVWVCVYARRYDNSGDVSGTVSLGEWMYLLWKNICTATIDSLNQFFSSLIIDDGHVYSSKCVCASQYI